MEKLNQGVFCVCVCQRVSDRMYDFSFSPSVIESEQRQEAAANVELKQC